MRADDAPRLGPALLRSADLEAYFGCSDRTIRRWAARGYLNPIHVGGSVFFHADDVKRLVRARLERVVGR